jgi:hypothetical protein
MNRTDQLLGKVFGLAPADAQAEVLNEAGRTLRRATSNETGNFDMQCCAIVDELDEDGKRFIEQIAAFVRSDREARQR